MARSTESNGIYSLCLWIGAIAMSTGCAAPKLEAVQSGTISRPTKFGFDNFTVVEIDPGPKQAVFVWKGYNEKDSNFVYLPFDTLTVASGSQLYEITDENVQNNEISVNGKIYHFDGFTEKQRLRIRIGDGIEVVDGGHYQGGMFLEVPNSK